MPGKAKLPPENLDPEHVPTPEPEGEAPPSETKAEKFVRLSKKRTQNALIYIGHIGNLSGNGYEWTAEQKTKIFTALRKAVDDCEARYAPKSKDGKPQFDFD